MSSAVNALLGIRNKLEDPFKRLNWTRKHDPCASNWTGVICYKDTSDGYMHVQELYVHIDTLFLRHSYFVGLL